MHRTILYLIGIAYVGLGLAQMANIWSGDVSFAVISYSAFLVIFGMMAFGAADIDDEAAKWFDYSAVGILGILAISGTVNFVHNGSSLQDNPLTLAIHSTGWLAMIYVDFIYAPA